MRYCGEGARKIRFGEFCAFASSEEALILSKQRRKQEFSSHIPRYSSKPYTFNNCVIAELHVDGCDESMSPFEFPTVRSWLTKWFNATFSNHPAHSYCIHAEGNS